MAGALAAAASATQAAPGAEFSISRVFQGIPHDALYDIAFEGERGLAVGDFGMILSAREGGSAWERNPEPFTDLALLGIALQAGRCIVVGQSGLVYASQDCRQWRRAQSESDARLMSVDVNRSGFAVAVGGFGAILKSTDWGQSWSAVTVEWDGVIEEFIEPHLYEVDVADDGTIVIVGEFELIMRSVDGGAEWQVVNRGKRSLFALTLLDNGTGFAAGQEGAVLRTADRGVSWQVLDVGSDAIFLDVWADEPGQVVLTGIRALLRSANGGDSWAASTAPEFTGAWFQALGSVPAAAAAAGQRAPPHRVYAVGHSGTVLNITW